METIILKSEKDPVVSGTLMNVDFDLQNELSTDALKLVVLYDALQVRLRKSISLLGASMRNLYDMNKSLLNVVEGRDGSVEVWC